MSTPESEAARTPWVRERYFDLLGTLERLAPRSLAIVGIDGRSGSGKSSLARGISALDSHIAVVHTDDVAWHHSFFDWAEMLVENVLVPLRDHGAPLSFRPPSWFDRDRLGAIEVPSGTSLVLIEGVGACRAELRPFLDAAVWVDASRQASSQRVAARGVDSPDFMAAWNAAEEVFLDADRPWEVADVVVSGELGQPSPNGRYGNVVTAEGPGLREPRG